ncbi:uncharacterized protein LOC119109987 [Pollicipes pollicipes]|uniref:uncharacterized protein LOC119109987 n=1 Tax=Pollicipes pollicipes TaxID=41117 RepID=UPI001884B627|nr:uncharacterized protein LOC119109987 [Pollicipes pollicipes]
MITVLLPEELAGRQQGSLTGVLERDGADGRRAALLVTGLEYRLPGARSLGYLISSEDSCGFSGAAFAYLHNYVVVANGAVPRVIRCVVRGAPVPPEAVTLVLYSPAAAMVRAVHAEGPPAPGRARMPFGVGWLHCTGCWSGCAWTCAA